MRVAIIGAGFAGLALSYHLLQSKGCQVTIFDPSGIGRGTSGISSGLLHPYAGEQARRSWRAEEGLKATLALLQIASDELQKPVADYSGIVRHALNEEQKSSLERHKEKYGDVKKEGDGFLITSGVTVFSKLYLEGLWRACEAKGAVLEKTKVHSLEEMSSYDAVILAGGAGSVGFPECANLPVSLLKGQVLTCKWGPLDRSLIGKGYVAKSEDPSLCHVGATYERGFTDSAPCLEKAKSELEPKISTFFPFHELSIVDSRAGIRVIRKGHYLPLVGQLTDKVWVFTALGSRGLLYHAYLAGLLADAILENKPLPQELHCALFKNRPAG